MPTIYNVDYRTIGYWFDEENGISNRYGFFRLLKIMSTDGTHPEIDYISYPDEAGNPINTWALYYEDPETPGAMRAAGIEYAELDNLFIDHSGDKLLRKRFLDRLINQNQAKKSAYIVERITRMYSKKWLALWNSMFYDYNPIENYNMIEKMTDDTTELEHGHIIERVDDLSHTKSGTEKDAPPENEAGHTETETSQMVGYNATDFVDANKTTRIRSGADQITYDLTETDSGSQTNTNSGTDTTTRNYELTRSGNIGVTTSQQMIEQERKLLMYNYFYETVFPDIDKILTLSVY